MSGVLLTMGLYGIIRMASFMAHPPLWWGATLLVAGTVSGVVGIVFAVVQHDFKRLLAYSSIENIGIMTIGVGLALIGRSLDRFDLIVLGMGGALFHLLNHSLFKPLLFMGAGSILHGTRMRQIDLLGGLARRMPGTFVWVIIGAVAICALPPLNGFIGELLIYMGLFRTASPGLGRTLLWVSLAAPALAVIGALAVAAFVKLIGVAFGGSPRTRAAARAHDPGKRMLGPMAILAICCIVIGVAPILVTPAIDRGVAAWDSLPGQMGISIRSLVPLNCISGVAFALIAVVLSGALMLRWLRQRRPMATAGTWDCGYALPGPTMQYTGSSFTQTLGSLFSWVLIPRRAIVRVVGLFPRRERFRSDTPDTVLDRALLPLFWAIERVLSWARPIQRGSVQVYLLYMLSILLILLMLAGWTR
jgi:hydrogenase-4 component B